MNDEQPAVDPQQDLSRPARKQVPGPITHDHKQQAGSGGVNIWSGRQLGPRGERGSRSERKQQPSAYRCRPKLDSGKTKGSSGNVNTFCTFFAKGMCYQGPDCPFLHRLPTSADNEAMAHNISSDIFGRDKMPAGLENKKGAGSYERDMTTLYVNYGGAGHYAVPQLRHMLLQDFGEFGPVRHIHIVPSKTIAFIKYHWRVSAEFAREAMDQQQLTGSTLHEVLSVRWAYDDPNPVAVFGRKRAALDAAEAAAMNAWDALPPEEKRARIAMAQQARARKVSAVASAMPEPLLAGAAGGQLADDSFDAWRGFSGRQQQQQQRVGQGNGAPPAATEAAGDAADGAGGADGQQQQQQQQWGDEGGAQALQSEADVQAAWQAYYAAHPDALQQQQELLQQQQQQESVQGSSSSWFTGWRQRHKPATYADPVAAASGPAIAGDGGGGGGEKAAAGVVGSGEEGGLGLLAGYGSDSEGS